MASYEQLYYESDSFWAGDMLQDEANQQRVKITVGIIPAAVDSLADIGCGNGVFINYLDKVKPGLDLLAIDRSETALKYVRTKKQTGDIENIPLADKSIDCVTCLEVIEHLPVPVYKKALAELSRVAKDYIIISVPYQENLEERINQCPSCKTIFNYELHVRSFDDEKMNGLLDEFGFSCMQLQHLGASHQYFGHHAFRKLFYKEQFKKWASPICPLCGFEDASQSQTHPVDNQLNVHKTGKRKLISYLAGLPKLVWPKIVKYYWVMALYKRI